MFIQWRKKYLDYGMGLRSVNLGYGEKSVIKEVLRNISKGNNLTYSFCVRIRCCKIDSQAYQISRDG